MRSSRGRPALGALLAVALLLGAGLGIGPVRGRLGAYYGALRDVDDVYALPSPEQTVALSLGHRAALADLLFAKVLVGFGIRSQERRRFEFLGRYLDTIVALDPTLRDTYYYADTLLTFQAVKPPIENHYKARALMERGLEQFPRDAELWLVTGQYVSFIAPGQLPDPEARQAWRTAGARMLARACEIQADDGILNRKCIGAASTLSDAGEREASIRFLERLLALSDDERIRARARALLEAELGRQLNATLADRRTRFRELHGADLRFIGRDLYLLLGPPFDPARCAGGAPSLDCATTWRDWFARLDADRERPLP